jgi:hypothetical protein
MLVVVAVAVLMNLVVKGVCYLELADQAVAVMADMADQTVLVL